MLAGDHFRRPRSLRAFRIPRNAIDRLVDLGELDDTYAIADIFLAKPQPLHDLLQKAVGWLLREAGKRDEQRLKDWLSIRYQTMPRTMLRYAIEKFSEEERQQFLKP